MAEGGVKPTGPQPPKLVEVGKPTIMSAGPVVTIINPKPIKGKDAAAFSKPFPLSTTNDDLSAKQMGEAVSAVNLGRTVSRAFGEGTINVEFDVGKDGKIKSVTCDGSSFKPSEGYTLEDATKQIAGRLANLRFSPQKEAVTVQVPIRF